MVFFHHFCFQPISEAKTVAETIIERPINLLAFLKKESESNHYFINFVDFSNVQWTVKSARSAG